MFDRVEVRKRVNIYYQALKYTGPFKAAILFNFPAL